MITINMSLIKDQISDYVKKLLFLSRSSYFWLLDGLSLSTTLAVFGGKFIDNSFGFCEIRDLLFFIFFKVFILK